MKTNFFEQVAGLGITGTLQINIQANESGILTVSVLLANANPTITAGKNIPPMLLKGSPQELDEAFFGQVGEPVKRAVKLFIDLEAYQAELDKAEKSTKKDKNNNKDKTAKTNTDEETDDEDGDNNLFAPKPDDKETKAEKKRIYDEAMLKVAQLNTDMKYKEALAQLPDAEEYPDKAEEINTKREQLEKRQQLYASLQTEV